MSTLREKYVEGREFCACCGRSTGPGQGSGVPVLRDHDPAQVIGTVRMDASGLVVEFKDGVGVTKEQFFSIFHCGATVLDSEVRDGKLILHRVRVFQFSQDTVLGVLRSE